LHEVALLLPFVLQVVVVLVELWLRRRWQVALPNAPHLHFLFSEWVRFHKFEQIVEAVEEVAESDAHEGMRESH